MLCLPKQGTTVAPREGNPVKQNIDRRDHWRRGKPREGTKRKPQALSNEKGKANPDRGATLEPNKGGTKKTITPKVNPRNYKVQLDLPQVDALQVRKELMLRDEILRPENVSGGNFHKQNRQHPKGRGRGASREGDKGTPLTSAAGRGKPPGKNQGQRPGKVNPANRNIKSATQHKTQPPACRPHKDVEKKSFPRKINVLDLKTLKEKDCTEVVYKLNESMAPFKFFLRSQEEQHNSDDFIFDLTCTLAIACDAPPDENTNKILAALKGSLFLSSKVPRLLDRVQGTSALNDQDSQPRLIQWLIKIFMRYLRHLPSSYADLPYDQLKRALDQSNIDRKDELQKELEAFKKVRDDIIRAERQKHGKRYINKAGQKPPNDFRDIPICPTNKEITSKERPFLRKNISKGRYEDAEHYLDVQFRLLREDFLEPLREGINEIVQNIPRRQRNQLMKLLPRSTYCRQDIHAVRN
ncbi:NFX1-type zinc finger-containing protein 1 [Desmophyllum pertusum]|uniref:NFX1-type zinc finger-containing protein 1 n=1 Tax=Desmophyllum pertusum TaxID=174260 RepID=A0A9W9ZNP0_9CNID|nr:NFX1-type zinc finger-containing protein 1 [Desmophyllum pertusum]